uniref:Calponin-homology (CH) domain-containing protein n=1 Tax=Salarias fasciatus TaxID=181472 RepID=A0A672GWM4_SALFA
MSLDKAELCDSLLTWLQTFQAPSCSSKQELTSGVAIAHVLHRIDPSWFNETWLGRIKEESEANWRLKVSNLKKILKSMLEYYHDILGHQVSDEHLPDVSLIGELGDVAELGKLVQLVLGCAVSCEKKQEQIQQIMTLEESVQHVVMTAIQEVSEKDGSALKTSPVSASESWYFLTFVTCCCRCCLPLLQLSVALEEKSSLQAEARSLKEKLSRSESLDASATAITGKKLLLLQSQMEQLQEENYRLESGRDDLRVRGEILEREVTELQLRNEELTSLAQEAQALKDEMDILRHSSDRVNQLEALVETYKRKLEDLGDLRRQVRLLEERNTVYMQRTCELEEELRRANAVRSQLDTYKRQAHELHSKHSAEAMKAEKWQFEYKNLHDKYDALLKEKERLISERDTLRETNDELRCAQVQQRCLSGRPLSGVELPAGPRSDLAVSWPPLRETVVRLQSENKMLCVQEETYRQKLADAQAELEEAQRSKNTLETQNRLNQQQISELRCQIEELQKALQEHHSNNEDVSGETRLRHFFVSLPAETRRERVSHLLSVAKKIDELQEILRKKDEDMKQMEERYKRYVEKARTVIKTLDPKQQPAPDIQALKNQLTEKERRIQHLEVGASRCGSSAWIHFTEASVRPLLSTTTRRAAPATTRRRSSSSQPGTTWWVRAHTQTHTERRPTSRRRLLLSGHGAASEGVGQADRLLRSDHVLPGPAETVHQRPRGLMRHHPR